MFKPQNGMMRMLECRLSNETNPGCLGYTGDEILPIYVGMIINDCNGPS